MSCECYVIGGPWITFDPNCPTHGYEAQREAEEREEAERAREIAAQEEADRRAEVDAQRDQVLVSQEIAIQERDEVIARQASRIEDLEGQVKALKKALGQEIKEEKPSTAAKTRRRRH